MNFLKSISIIVTRMKAEKNKLCYNKRALSNYKKDNSTLSVYSSDQQLQILDTLQKCVLNNETRPYLNGKRLESLKELFQQNQNLQNLEPLMNVSGFGPKRFHKLCDSILQELVKVKSTKEVVEDLEDTKTVTDTVIKLPSNLIVPTHILQKPVEKIVSIELGINAISWARLNLADSESGLTEVDSWDVLDLAEFADKKYDVHAVWDLVMYLRDEIPDGDIFVMENNNWSNISNVKKPMKYHIQEAMLTTAICSIFNQSDSGRQPRPVLFNRVYFMRTFIPSRLFRKIIGSERVSAQDVVQEMIDGVTDERYQPLTFANQRADYYLSLNGSLRDNMSRALLLVVSFLELVVRKNPVALSEIGRVSGIKKKKR